MKRETGLTLVELVVTIAVLAIAVTGVLLVLNQNIAHSADPMVEQQAVNIAEAYLDEILNQSFTDPDGSDAGETRATYDDVNDYNGLSEAPHDQSGNAIAGLSNYTVTVTVTQNVALGTDANATRVDVNVVYAPTNISITLSGYRANY
jgi:MSHA pilin protein MshD